MHVVFAKYLIFFIVCFCSVLNPASASDVEVWDLPLTCSEYMGTPFASLKTGRSPIYEKTAIYMQRAPALHPYHPSDGIVGEDLLHMSISVKIPLRNFFDRIPELFQKKIRVLGKAPCDFYISFQNLPYSMERKILLRPQYWMFPGVKATMKGMSLVESIEMTALGRGIELAGHKGGILTEKIKHISAHGPKKGVGNTVLSAGKPVLSTRKNLLHRPLWVLTTASPGTKKMRSALSLFFPMCNSSHRYVVEKIISGKKTLTLRSIYENLIDTPHGGPLLAPLKKLMEKRKSK